MTAEYRVHDHLGQGWIEVSTLEIRSLGLGKQLSGRSRIAPGGDLVYVHEGDDFKRFIQAKGIPPEALPLDEDVVVRSPVGGYAEYRAADHDEKPS